MGVDMVTRKIVVHESNDKEFDIDLKVGKSMLRSDDNEDMAKSNICTGHGTQYCTALCK